MKKKIFSIAAVVLFASVSLSANNKTEKEQTEQINNDCTEDTFDFMDFLGDMGVDDGQASCLGNAYYAVCEGYEDTSGDCL
ncbi:hypothetical protein [Cellulophaga fucicola]|uniref:NVEALA protein n=1 Tax=Cellulophaga fucicola TaxID=76595 RepID=A0A1K1QN03_9FLAO|nr:hypothetical protein [Cellulophaga fucicola]SFW61003.1 hypothetical protein SAMN05660313_02795 [Cellulophaga fucicola]